MASGGGAVRQLRKGSGSAERKDPAGTPRANLGPMPGRVLANLGFFETLRLATFVVYDAKNPLNNSLVRLSTDCPWRDDPRGGTGRMTAWCSIGLNRARKLEYLNDDVRARYATTLK
jgi:hypothetical protein